MASFYGGQQGKDFRIKKIFKNKKEDLISDLNLGFDSPVGVGELAIISYGLNSGDTFSEDYKNNQDKDKKAYNGKTYNATLWQKIYSNKSLNLSPDILTGIETVYQSETQNGFGYLLITSLAGFIGPQGEPGSGLNIKGYYNTLEELQQAIKNPAPGDAYGIGVKVPYNIYIYDGNTKKWIDNGYLQGPEGPQGPQGDSILFTPFVSLEGDLTWTNNGNLPNPEKVNIRGPKGTALQWGSF